jgi:hypothetical protein
MNWICVQGPDTQAKLKACRLTSNTTLGVFVTKGARVELTSCELSGNRSTGAEVGGRGTTALWTRCSLTDNGRVGLYVHSAALAQLVGSQVRASADCAILCGGVIAGGLAGGLVEHSTKCKVRGRLLSCHGGRIRQAVQDCEDLQ